jgi:hypothetical protein
MIRTFAFERDKTGERQEEHGVMCWWKLWQAKRPKRNSSQQLRNGCSTKPLGYIFRFRDAEEVEEKRTAARKNGVEERPNDLLSTSD